MHDDREREQTKPPMLRVAALLIVMVSLFSTSVLAQRIVPRVKNFTPGIPHGRDMGWGVAQDAKGNVFLGDLENSQVLIFDGVNWQATPIPNGPVDLASDENGLVWVGTEHGIGYLHQDALGHFLYCAVHLDVEDGVEQRMACAHPVAAGVCFFSPKLCVRCASDEKPVVWVANERQHIVGVDDERIYVFESESGQLVTIGSDRQVEEIADLDGRLVDVVGRIDGERLLIWHGNRLEILKDGKFTEFSAALHMMADKGRNVFFILPMLDGIVAAAHGELLFLDFEGKVKYRLGVADGLVDSLIVRVLSDQVGNLWLAHSEGLTCVYHSNPVRKLVRNSGEIKDCFSIVSVENYLAYVSRSRMILGRNLGASDSEADNEPSQMVVTRGLEFFPIIHPTRILFADRFGVYEFKEGKRISLVGESNELVSGVAINDCVVLSEISGRIRVGRMGESAIQKLQVFDMPDAQVIAADGEDAVWVYSLDSLINLQFKEGWENAPVRIETKECELAYFDRLTQKLIGVLDNRFVLPRRVGDKIVVEPLQSHRRLEANLYSVANVGPDGSLLMVAGKTVVQLKADDESVFSPTPHRSWEFPERLRECHFDEANHRLMAAGRRALYTCDIDTPSDQPLAIPNIVLQVKDAQTDKKVPLNEVSGATDFAFMFGSTSSNGVGVIEYRYRLSGLEEGFSEWSKNSQVEYSRLPPGQYRFELESRRGSEVVATRFQRTITMPGPAYHSWWAILIYFGVTSMAVWGAVALRYRQVATRRSKLERIVRQQTQQLEQQSASLQRANRKLREEIQAVKESERRRGELEGRLLESERLESLGHLAGGIAHDFNNMLAVVMSNAELMDELDPDQEECREQIILVSQQAAELCNQMLMVSGGGSVDIQVHNLNDIVGNLKSLLESTVQPLRLELELDSSRALPVEVDRSQITQLVLNLVTNAADAARTEKGSDVRLATGLSYFSEAKLEAARCIDGRPTSGDYVWLSVVDEGAGIDSETRRRMFDPFYSTKSQGRGLGLATVLRVVSRHRGAVMVETVAGMGTCMQVLLPASTHVAERVSEFPGIQEAASMNGDTDRVLLVDDDDAIRIALSKVLAKAGFECVSFDNGIDCIEEARHARNYHAAIVDLSMPKMNGADVIRELRVLAPELPVVVISGYSVHNPTSDNLPTYKTRFLGKPFSPSDLITHLRELLEEKTSRV